MNCIIQERADIAGVAAGDNELIEPDMIDETSIADPECCPSRILGLWDDGKNNTGLYKQKQIRKYDLGRADKGFWLTSAPMSGPPNL